MESTCTLCGVAISSNFPERWLGEFRAIYSRPPSFDDISLSGVGIAGVLNPDELEVMSVAECPWEASKRYDDMDLDHNSIIPIKLGQESLNPRANHIPYCGFVFHAACWDLLCKIVVPDLPVLFNICLSMPVRERDTIQWSHDYGGAAVPSPNNNYLIGAFPGDLARHIGSSVFRSDPFDIPDLHLILESTIVFDPPAYPWLSFQPSSDVFNRLPAEILQDIAVNISSADLASLRLTSRIFNHLELPESFWASRFEAGHECHHFFEISLRRPRSWKSIYMLLRVLTRQSPGIRNRRRIWGLGLKLKKMHDMMVGAPCQGMPLANFFEQEGTHYTGTWHVACWGRRRSHYYPLDDGCRVMRERTTYLPSPVELEGVVVSFVHVSGQKFVSGLQFLTKDGGNRSLGYIVPNQQQISLCPPGNVVGWHLALSASGIVALALETIDKRLSPWAGEPGNFPRWRLSTPQDVHVKADFDAMRLLSFGFEVITELSWKDRCVWASTIPAPGILCDSYRDEEQYEFTRHWRQYSPPLLSTALFQPSTLIEITGHIFDVNNIGGIEFRHTDSRMDSLLGQRMPFQRRPRHRREGTLSRPDMEDHQTSFAIDGPGGERVTEIRLVDNATTRLAFEVVTNFGREKALFMTKSDPLAHDAWKTTWGRKSISIKPSGSEVVGIFASCEHLILNHYGLLSMDVDMDAADGAGVPDLARARELARQSQ